MNSGYAYGISPVPVPDNKFNDGSYLEDLNRWAPAFTSWLNANSNTETFYLYYDSVFEEYTIKRLKPISGRRGTHLYRDEAVQHSQTIDIFTKHPEVTYVTLGIVPGGGGSAYLKFISGQKEVKKIVIPKQDLYIRQSEYDAQARERERLEAEARKRNAVKAGLGSRKGSTNSIDERGAVRIPHKVSLKGFQLFVLGESSEEKITDVDINNIDGLGLIKNKISIGTHQAALQLQTAQNGNQELAKTVFGRRTVTVRTTTQGGNVATKDITLTFGMPTPRITTSNDDLREKSNTKPTVKATIPGPIDPRNIPQGHKLMMFLVSGGSNDSSDHDDVHATGYHIVAQTEVGQDGQAIFGESKYIDGQIGTQNLRAVAAVVPDGTTTPLQGLVSALSENFVAATEPLRKDAAQQALEDAAQRKRDAIDQDKGLIDTEKQAAKEKVNEALEAAKRTLQDATNEDGIRDAQQGGERAIQNVGQTGVAKPTAQQALEDAAQRKRDAIDQDKGLIDTEKQAAKEKVNEALEAAKRTLQDATNEDGIRDAQQGGERAIQNVGQTGVAKPTAQQALEDAAQSGTNPVTPPSATRSRRTPPRRSRRSVGFVGNSQTGTTPSAVDKSELQSLVDDLERRLQDLADLSPESLEEAQRILREAQVALANDSLTAQELAELLAKVRQALNSIQAGTSADKSPSTSDSNKEAESAKEPTNATDVPLYGVFGAAVLSLLGALLFAVARKKNSQLDKLSRELDQLLVELEASDKDKKGLGKAKKLAKKARTFVDSQQKDPQKEAELISEIKTILSQLREGV
ncbi:surface anchored protein [Streptococcus pneumoniae]|nr:surface anchored protein [Streptococcus pneumoniae]VLM24014.1 surface anchored protein [Streptococcus pneumoniae]VNL49750.1 surface anchored protein [Streptococcus pneumoniae]